MALVVMAVLAGLAWRGLDVLVSARDGSRAAVDRSVRLGTVLTQWEQDLASVHDTGLVPALAFDGRMLRLTRAADDGVRLVAWSLEGGAWLRWSSPPTTRQGELQELWLRSQALDASAPGQVRLAEGVLEWQVYCFRGATWSNCQSSGDLVVAAVAPPSPPASAASDADDGGAGRDAAPREALPGAVRLVVTWPEGRLLRDIALGPQMP